MRILVDLVAAGPGVGGISRYCAELQARLGDRVVFRPSQVTAGPLGRVPLLRQLPLGLTGRPRGDVVHFGQIVGSGIMLFRRLPPTAVTVHDLGFLVWPPERQTFGPAARLLLRLSFAGLRRAHRLIANSWFTRDTLVHRLHVPPDRIRVTLFGVDHGVFHRRADARRALEERWGLGGWNKWRTLVAVGSELPRKNVPGLLRTVAAFRDLGEPVRLVKVGAAGGRDHRRSTLAAIAALRLEDRVRLVDQADDGDLALLYNAADTYVCASHLEGFSLPTLEALACGTPVVVSAAGALPELVADAGVVVRDQDAAAWVAAIDRVLRDAAFAAQLRDAGAQRARHYDWGHTAAQTLDVYRDLAAGRHGAPVPHRLGDTA